MRWLGLRTLQDWLKRAEAAPEQGMWECCRTIRSHLYEDTILEAQSSFPSRSLQYLWGGSTSNSFSGVCFISPWGTIYFFTLVLNFHLVFLLPHIVSSEETPPLRMGQKQNYHFWISKAGVGWDFHSQPKSLFHLGLLSSLVIVI